MVLGRLEDVLFKTPLSRFSRVLSPRKQGAVGHRIAAFPSQQGKWRAQRNGGVLIAKLLEQTQHCTRILICLCQHCLRRLREHIVLRISRHLLRHIGVTDRRLRRLHILRGNNQVAAGETKAVLYRTDGDCLICCTNQRILECINCCIRRFLRRYLNFRA